MSSDCSTTDGKLNCTVAALNKLLVPVINGQKGSFELQTAAFCALCRAQQMFQSIAGDDVSAEIKAQLSKLINNTGTGTVTAFEIIFGGIVVLFILLTITYYISLLYQTTPYLSITLFVISLLMIIITAVVIYFLVRSVYDTQSTTVVNNVSNVGIILTNVVKALVPSLCCTGCISCQNEKPCLQCDIPVLCDV